MRSTLPTKVRDAIIVDFREIFALVSGYVDRKRSPRKDRHKIAWRPEDVAKWKKGSPHLRYKLVPAVRPGRSAIPHRGRPRDAGMWTAIDLLAYLYEERTGRRPGSGATGPFSEVVAYALPNRDVDKLIRQVVKARGPVRLP